MGKNLPTPQKVAGHPSLYHVYMVLLAAVVIGGLPYYRAHKTDWKHVCGEFVFLLVIFFLAQDFLWFVMNPGYTVLGYVSPLSPGTRTGSWAFPLFNYVGAAVLCVLLFLMPGSPESGSPLHWAHARPASSPSCAHPPRTISSTTNPTPLLRGASRNPELCGSEISSENRRMVAEKKNDALRGGRPDFVEPENDRQGPAARKDLDPKQRGGGGEEQPVQGLWRWVYGEKRTLNLQFLTQVFERSFAYLQMHPADFRVMTEIRNATQGLQNLKTTYEDDPLTVARIQVLIDNIESKMSVEPVPILAIKNMV